MAACAIGQVDKKMLSKKVGQDLAKTLRDVAELNHVRLLQHGVGHLDPSRNDPALRLLRLLHHVGRDELLVVLVQHVPHAVAVSGRRIVTPFAMHCS